MRHYQQLISCFTLRNRRALRRHKTALIRDRWIRHVRWAHFGGNTWMFYDTPIRSNNRSCRCGRCQGELTIQDKRNRLKMLEDMRQIEIVDSCFRR
jgi:hypothetical protein